MFLDEFGDLPDMFWWFRGIEKQEASDHHYEEDKAMGESANVAVGDIVNPANIDGGGDGSGKRNHDYGAVDSGESLASKVAGPYQSSRSPAYSSTEAG